MTLWDLNIKIGKEKETLYSMGKNLNEEEKKEWTRQYEYIKSLYIIFNAYKKGKMTKDQQQQIIINRFE